VFLGQSSIRAGERAPEILEKSRCPVQLSAPVFPAPARRPLVLVSLVLRRGRPQPSQTLLL
jgi:hypothetical protein